MFKPGSPWFNLPSFLTVVPNCCWYVFLLGKNPFTKCVPVPFNGTCASVEPRTFAVLRRPLPRVLSFPDNPGSEGR